MRKKMLTTKQVICKQCGREFKGLSALGGHARSAHKKTGQEASKPTPSSPQPKTTQTDPTEPSQAEQIRDLLQQGYSISQLVGKFHFKESTVRLEMRKFVEPENKPLDEDNSKNDGLLPITVKLTELITPEAVLQRYMDGEDDEKELRGIMKFRAAMLMVMDLMKVVDAKNESQSKMIEATLKVMRESREEMDAAALRSKASVDEAAKKAAEDTASRVADYLEPRLAALEQKKPDIATTQNPMQGVMARSLEAIMDRLMNSLAPGSQGQNVQSSLPQGWTQESVKEQ